MMAHGITAAATSPPPECRCTPEESAKSWPLLVLHPLIIHKQLLSWSVCPRRLSLPLHCDPTAAPPSNRVTFVSVWLKALFNFKVIQPQSNICKQKEFTPELISSFRYRRWEWTASFKIGSLHFRKCLTEFRGLSMLILIVFCLL